MANILANIIQARNVVGTMREAYVQVSDQNGSTGGAVYTGLSWVEDIDVMQPFASVGGDRQIDTWPNSKTASATEDDPGWIFYQNGAGSGQIYRFMVRGR